MTEPRIVEAAVIRPGDRVLISVDGRFGDLGDIDAACLHRLLEQVQQFLGDVPVLLVAGASLTVQSGPVATFDNQGDPMRPPACQHGRHVGVYPATYRTGNVQPVCAWCDSEVRR